MTVAVAGALLLALGMGFANAAVFKLVPRYSPTAVGGAAGIVGGLGAFGGFVIPPVMGLFVRNLGRDGYAMGFVVFLGLSLVALPLLALLHRQKPSGA
jgi:NNP family nitrate/nitrite transporter-like MFS transporter